MPQRKYNICYMGKYGNRPREDKATLTEPRCPFCQELFDRPYTISTNLGFFTGGKCICGAVYVFDASNKNMGEAFMDALTYACAENWDLAMSLEPNKDYQERSVTYSSLSHSVSSKRTDLSVREKAGNMIFIRLEKEQLDKSKVEIV
ncbi:HEAT domain-containing protein [Candidatus Magnetobacterium bavaricum]|uniref:HEAT domain-containing protein n=1 Tax=Candidatus Magnetobacterium bavaricum TaxID=29290 RepID=A0A0F3H2L1_9BACT|nr:HEAT domain-containing protein [Candidatus Magnetobacterium bavaricum]